MSNGEWSLGPRDSKTRQEEAVGERAWEVRPPSQKKQPTKVSVTNPGCVCHIVSCIVFKLFQGY